MKALSIKQPWASLIVAGIKDIENRTWHTNFRGRIYVHASAKESGQLYELLDYDQRAFMHRVWDADFLPHRPLSAIIGQVDIIGCTVNHSSIWAEKVHMPLGVYMGEPVIYNWVLANPVQFDNPILGVKGKLSFWEWGEVYEKAN